VHLPEREIAGTSNDAASASGIPHQGLADDTDKVGLTLGAGLAEDALEILPRAALGDPEYRCNLLTLGIVGLHQRRRRAKERLPLRRIERRVVTRSTAVRSWPMRANQGSFKKSRQRKSIGNIKPAPKNINK